MSVPVIDINCDMGEGFGHWLAAGADDATLMPLITSANIAAGFHAGDPNIMDDAVRLACQHGVGIGVHPGYPDKQGFGRRTIRASDAELINDIVYQIGALQAFARRHGTDIQHVKPHGALYMDMASSESLSEAFISAMRRIAPHAPILCMGVSQTYRAACRMGHPVVREFYADRDYAKSGSIVFTRHVSRPHPDAIAAKVLRACVDGRVATVDGDEIAIEFESICFHSDTPGSAEIGAAVRKLLVANGIGIQSFARSKT